LGKFTWEYERAESVIVIIPVTATLSFCVNAILFGLYPVFVLSFSTSNSVNPKLYFCIKNLFLSIILFSPFETEE
jgi:hypothetical protein